jgi:uncharacterized protein (DUF362 family)
MKRREFVRGAGVLGISALINPSGLLSAGKQGFPDIVVTQNGEPASLVRSAIEEMGGMTRFISRGDIVVVKPNISWDRVPKQAATTNPEIVSEVIKMCWEAGAKKVKVFDHTLNEPKRCYKRSGIEQAVKESDGDIHHIYNRKFRKTKLPDGELVKSWEVYNEVLEADKVINIPIAKHHSIPGISLAMKNVMGFLGGNRGKLHRQFDTKITDINTLIRSDLIVLDAYRMLLRNGPSGGNLADVSLKKTVAVGTDIVAVDSYGASLFGLNPNEISFLVTANQRGLGQNDLRKISIKTIPLSM